MNTAFDRPRNIRGKYFRIDSRAALEAKWDRGEIDNSNYLLAMDILSYILYRKLTSSAPIPVSNHPIFSYSESLG